MMVSSFLVKPRNTGNRLSRIFIMCGRFALRAPASDVAKEFALWMSLHYFSCTSGVGRPPRKPE